MKRKIGIVLLATILMSAMCVFAANPDTTSGVCGSVTVYGTSYVNSVPSGSGSSRTYTTAGSGYVRVTCTTAFMRLGTGGTQIVSCSKTADSATTMDVTAVCNLGSEYKPISTHGVHFAAIGGQTWTGSTTAE